MKKLALIAIRAYQKTLSPDHGVFRARFPYGYCKFYPSCSEYTYQSIDTFGLIKGIFKSTWRIMRCNPWSRGGLDPVSSVIPDSATGGDPGPRKVTGSRIAASRLPG